MRIKHYAWQEVDGVERRVVIDGRTNSWVKRINGCTMTWFKEDGWEEVVEDTFVDAMEDVVATPEGHLQLWKDGQISHSFFPREWVFEKTVFYDWDTQSMRGCLIVKKKVRGS